MKSRRYLRVESAIAAVAVVALGSTMIALPNIAQNVEDPVRVALKRSKDERLQPCIPQQQQQQGLPIVPLPDDEASKESISQQQQEKAITTSTSAEAASTSSYSFPHRYPNNHSTPILPKILAIYFPQYHSDPLNDQLWGKGFTDWDNLRSSPEFNRKGFKIMRPTTELGYYNLLDANIRKKQGEMAASYGIDGFVYHHYWFYDDTHPGPTLHGPLMKMLEDGYPDLPFALNWVAENWTATWHRTTSNNTAADATDMERDKEMLQQQYFPNDPKTDPRVTAHYRWLRLFFHHHNYLKDPTGKPILMVYRHEDGMHPIIPRFKELAKEDGFPGLHVALGMYATNDELFPRGKGLGKYETLDGPNADVYDRLTNYPYPYDWQKREKMQPPDWCMKYESHGRPRSNNIIGVVSSFDNTPRREFNMSRLWVTREGISGVRRHFSKNLWSAIYYHACCFAEGGTNQFILINAWNEWAEGMALEPSDVFGTNFLKTIKLLVTKQFTSCARSLLP